MNETLLIDGRFGEGGGQILRTSLSLSALLQRPVEIHHIRGGRKKPGLRPQHLTGVKAMASITSAEVDGARPGSTHLYFKPVGIKSGNYAIDIETAGSTGLVLQTMIPALIFGQSQSKVLITGGTHVPWSPSFDYVKGVFVPALWEMGVSVSLEIEQWGWYPKGGGKITAWISPVSELHAIDRTGRGKIQDLDVLSTISNLPTSIGERQRDQVIQRLVGQGLHAT